MLAASPGAKAARTGAASRTRMMKALAPTSKKARKEVEKATKQALGTFVSVAKRFPDDDIDALLAKDAVSSGLSKPFKATESAVKALVKTAYGTGYASGVEQAIVELKAAGYKVPTVDFTLNAKDYKVYQDDVENNYSTTGTRLKEVLQKHGGPKTQQNALESSLRDLVNRGQYSVEAAGKKGFADGKRAMMKLAKVKKVRWITRFGPGTCKFCAALHNTVVPIGQAFKTDAPLKAKYGPLYHPPVHVSCQCQVIPEPIQVT